MHSNENEKAEVLSLIGLGFEPEQVFDCLYRPQCLNSLQTSHKQASTVRRQGQLVKDKLMDHFVTMQVSSKTAAAIHRINLANMGTAWVQLRSNLTYLCCLQEKPENTFPCGHSICNVSVRIYGRPVVEAEYVYMLDQCIYPSQ